MVRDFKLPSTAPKFSAIVGYIAGSLEALRSVFWGSGTPSVGVRVGGMVFGDTDDGALKIRNVADTSDHYLAPVVEKLDERGWGSAFSTWLMPPLQGARLKSIRVVSTTATTSSADGSKDYNFTLYNETQGANLFSAQPGTGNSVVGVGGGEIPANALYELTPNQNAVIDADDAVRFTVGVAGSPTSLVRAAIYAVWTWDHS